MNAQRRGAITRIGAVTADPFASLRASPAAIADLAFGSFSAGPQPLAGQHLAVLPNEALELDLGDPAQRLLGDYELLELIGEGGMGVVYRARQLSLDREVAVKLLAAGPWASRDFVERFRREAQNAARMQHPNIVPVYEVGDAGDLQFFSMRLVRGQSLAALLKREGKLDVPHAARLLHTVAEAVDYAHRLGVLHLDLKPANVLIDENGTPHVADFGLARRLEQGLAADNTEVSGTPSYMAPEQAVAGAQKITPATDIWGLGAVLYELVTGEPPFLGNCAQATLELVVGAELRSPRRYTPGLPRDLEAIIVKCMARPAAERYGTARELADDLARLLEGRAVRARPLNPAQRAWRWARRDPRLAVTAVLAAAALVVGFATTAQQWRRAEEQRVQAEEQKRRAEENAALSNERLWASRREAALRLQKDGKAFQSLPQLIANVDEQERSGRSASIERREIGMIFGQGLTLIDRFIIADANPIAAALSPDGSLLAVALNDVSVRWYDTATLGERGRISLVDEPTSDGETHVPQLLEFIDDHRLRVTLEWYNYLINPADGDTLLVDLDAAAAIKPPAAAARFDHATFSRDGRHALLLDGNQRFQFWQVEPWQPLSPPIPATSNASVPYLLYGDGTAALHLRFGQSGISRVGARPGAASSLVALPPHRDLSAWCESHDHRLLALGDADGLVFVVDMATWNVRQLAIPTGRATNWLAFSEDDAWLAAGRQDGAAFVFDANTGVSLHAGQLDHEFALRRVEVNRSQRLLIASGNGEVALWRLPEPGPGGLPATRIRATATPAAQAGPFWAHAALPAALLATAAYEGEVRLWRLARPVQLPERSARHVAEQAPFDGEHLPDVEFNRVRVVSLRDPAASTTWRELPQSISFAELVDGSRTLVVVAGHSLHVYDAATLQPRYAAVELAGDPLRLAVDAGGRRAVLSYPRNEAAGFREVLESWDLRSGARLPASASLSAPLRRLAMSADGTQLLAVGPAGGATEVLDAATLHRRGVYPHDRERPVVWADFAPQDTVWCVTRDADDQLGDNAELIRWQIAGGRVVERRAAAGVWPVGLAVLGDRPLLAGKDRLVFDPGAPDARATERSALSGFSTVFAVSHDGQRVAHVAGRDVQVYDAASMTPVGAPLHTDIAMIDAIVQLEFSPHDDLLLGRTASRRRFLWKVGADERAVDALNEDADLLRAQTGAARVLRAPAAAERTRLRSRDPGAPPAPRDRPVLAIARRIEGSPVPQRLPGTSPLLLDLTEAYTSAPDSTYNFIESIMPSMRDFPVGVVRIDGVDYDVRGGVELRWADGGRLGGSSAIPVGKALLGVDVPARPIAAFHLLMYAPLPVSTSTEQVYANLVVHYRDGSRATLPVRTNSEVPGWNERDARTPIGWVLGDDLRLTGALRQRLVSNPRLANPHPERLIASIDVTTPESTWSAPMIFAITAEAVIPAANLPTTR